jgi:putative redox protein
MSERVVLRQKINFETEIRAADPHDPESDDLQPVEQVFSLTPYGMLLVSLAGCTAVLLNTYAQNHNIGLTEVELRMEFSRVFADDCEQCEEVDEHGEVIEEEIVFRGDMTPAQRQKLLMISRHCPIHRMLHEGIEVHSRLVDK